MSTSKFAAVTASLLARKGDATPSDIMPVTALPSRPALVPLEVRGAPRELPLPPSEPRRSENPDKLRRIVVSVTQEELEKLGIAAIKRGVSRHDIVRGALDDYFRKLSAELSHPCVCMGAGPAVLDR